MFAYLDKKKLYIVAVSGGPDSIFCLDKMKNEGYRLIVCHVNYQKRNNSDYDENIVKEYCKKNNLVLEILKSKKEKKKCNFQAWARYFRYNFFFNMAKKYKSNHIIIAHNLDDHIETFLLQKERKNLVNYWGLPFCLNWKNVDIIRPILSYIKEYIINYLLNKKINFVFDESNESSLYRRNIIRSHIKKKNIFEKKEIIKEIIKENKKLTKKKNIFENQKKNFILGSHLLSLKKKKISQEIYFRLLFFWINKKTNGIFYHRKKNILNEVYKQLFISKKKNILINLGKNWLINKKGDKALIYRNM